MDEHEPVDQRAKPGPPVGRTRPNILVIIVDQLRFPQGSFDQQLMDHAAPNLAKLRRQSVSFDAHYAAATACSPSRACMLTGLYTHQTAVFLTSLASFAAFRPTPPLNPGFPTWGSILSGDLGYRTIWWGKWHLSTECPLDRYGFQAGALPCPSPNGSPGQGLYVDPTIADLFCDWLAAYDDLDPWCTTVSLVNPHDIAWFPRYSRQVPGEVSPPAIPAFHAGLPANFERWPQALLQPGKPSAQAALALIADLIIGPMPYHGPGFREPWFELLDLYYFLTQQVDRQIGRVLRALEQSRFAENTIIIFTADHGEYGGAHGLRGKAFAVYEESIHVPFYVKDSTGILIPAEQVGTRRAELTSHVDLVPLLLTLATGSNAWRQAPRYAYLAGRADLAVMLKDPTARGRDYILHTSDEEIPEEGPELGYAYQDVRVRRAPLPMPWRRSVPTHVIGYRTRRAKLGVYSHWRPGTIEVLAAGQQAELYDYARYGLGEVVNNAPGGSMPDVPRFHALYQALFDPQWGALSRELRQPLPPFLQGIQWQAFADYLAYEASTRSL